MLSTVTLLSLNFAGAKSRAYSSAPPWATGTNDDGAWARAALLSGLPGIGKTSSAMVVCRDLGFTTCELNASDCRSKRSLQEEISQTLGMQNLKQMACGEGKLSNNPPDAVALVVFLPLISISSRFNVAPKAIAVVSH